MKFKKTTKNTIIFEHIEKIITDEVDFERYIDILGKKDMDEAYEEWGPIEIDNGTEYYNQPVKIDEVIKILNDLKAKGANYVGIDFNIDHPDYTFDGLKVRRATEEDIKKEEEKEKLKTINEANELRKKANELIEQAQKLIGK